MKKLLTFSLALVLGTSLTYSQNKAFSLTRASHGLQQNLANKMILAKYIDPGMGGAGQYWDFSQLLRTKDFIGQLKESLNLKSAGVSMDHNLQLIEFGNSFYFNNSNEQIELVGYVSKSGNYKVTLDRPFLKMKYPFTYGDAFNGQYGGKFTSGTVEGTIDGTYDVEADGYGTVVLPNGTKIEDVLRVKEIRNYTRAYGTSSNDVTVTTYRFYAEDERYPIVVLINTEMESNGRKSISQQAAYKNEFSPNTPSILAQTEISVFPNPTDDQFNINYELAADGNVLIEVFDVAGKKVATLLDEGQLKGDHQRTFSANELNMMQGTYSIRLRAGAETKVLTLVKQGN